MQIVNERADKGIGPDQGGIDASGRLGVAAMSERKRHPEEFKREAVRLPEQDLHRPGRCWSPRSPSSPGPGPEVANPALCQNPTHLDPAETAAFLRGSRGRYSRWGIAASVVTPSRSGAAWGGDVG